jgi:hypothetical protein
VYSFAMSRPGGPFKLSARERRRKSEKQTHLCSGGRRQCSESESGSLPSTSRRYHLPVEAFGDRRIAQISAFMLAQALVRRDALGNRCYAPSSFFPDAWQASLTFGLMLHFSESSHQSPSHSNDPHGLRTLSILYLRDSQIEAQNRGRTVRNTKQQ